jgi:hypothetical protein
LGTRREPVEEGARLDRGVGARRGNATFLLLVAGGLVTSNQAVSPSSIGELVAG